jgi:hypothetical protein
LLLYRWISSVMALPTAARPNLWTSGLLVAACGIGIAAAVKAVIGPASVRRIGHLATTFGCAAVALLVAAAWEWASVVLVLMLIGLGAWMWKARRGEADARADDVADPAREPLLICGVSAALLLLLLGTWQHVVDNETRRHTRSQRFSAWPRPSALRDAWERTDWTAKRDDPVAAERAEQAASREQLVALGLGGLLLAAAVAARQTAPSNVPLREPDHAS